MATRTEVTAAELLVWAYAEAKRLRGLEAEIVALRDRPLDDGLPLLAPPAVTAVA